MKKFFRWFLRVVGILVVLVVLWIGTNWGHVKHFPSIISAFYSKSMCSCLYVMKQDEAYCHNFARQWVPIQKVSIDNKAKAVTVKGLWRTNRASYRGPRFGCTIDKQK